MFTLHFPQNVHDLIGRKQWVKWNVVIWSPWLSNAVISFPSIKLRWYQSSALTCMCLHLYTLYMCLDCVCPPASVYTCVFVCAWLPSVFAISLSWPGENRLSGCVSKAAKAESQRMQPFHRLVLRQWKPPLLWQPIKPAGDHFPR